MGKRPNSQADKRPPVLRELGALGAASELYNPLAIARVVHQPNPPLTTVYFLGGVPKLELKGEDARWVWDHFQALAGVPEEKRT